ncbi:MAG: helix-turn-helix domain-containing protein [Candidatus Pacebacteria bacterium]|nr:helix-turn-helix domain-containing protein [Candidatus Paceibacterota bacterium]
MVEFKIKKLFERQLSWGEKFKLTREDRLLSLNKASKDLGIKTAYLEQIENNEFSQLPSGLYGRQFVLKYATYLNLDTKFLNDLFQVSNGQTGDCFSHEKLSKKKFLIFPKIVKNSAIFLVIAICLSYFSFYFFNLVSPPSLSISYPPENFVAQENILKLSGVTDPEALITINGEVVLNNEGVFNKEIDLKSGVNKITITSKQKYSKKNIITRQILLEKQYGKN